ncbi:beta-lactamase family protein [Apiospora arundinis]|uniref:Beta-lactamase family protein n=1 Tax=Apiospora arundinis TaxID=335852 RepID=A0ABR2IBB1_9PEZI
MDEYIRSAAFQVRIEAMMRAHHVPGLSMAIVHKGKTTSVGWGKASLDPLKPCTPDTLFDIASCSKSLTAASVALLVDDDENYPEVQWDAVMSELLPDDFVMPGVGYTEGITVDDILSHRTGMPRHDLSYLGPLASKTDDARSVTRNLRNLSVCAPLRSKFLYNNMMYTVATHLVEVKTKKTFSDFLDERFFVPLGMQSTCLQPSEARRRGLGDRIGTGYDWDKTTSTYLDIEWPDAPEAQGAGLVVSSANDLIKWVKALLDHNEDPINGRVYQGLVRLRTMSESTWKSQKKRRPHATPPVYAAGLEVHTYRGQRVVSHDGSGFGFSGRLFLLPDLKFGAVILGNAEGAFDVQCLVTKELIDELLEVPMQERLYMQQFTKTKTKEKKKKTSKPAKVKDSRTPPEVPAKSEEEKDRSNGDAEKTKEVARDNMNAEPRSSEGAKKQEDTPSKTPSNPHIAPLSAYTGPYWHPGYRQLTVEIREGKLFVNAPDRSYGFSLTFEHVADDAKFAAHMKYLLSAGASSPIDAEFVWENGRVVRMGLDLEEDVKEIIWFEKKTGDVHEAVGGPKGLSVNEGAVN